MSKEEKMSDDNKALVRRLFDEVFSPENLAAADEIMAKDYIEHAVAPFGSDEPGRVHGRSHTRRTVESLQAEFPDLETTIECVVTPGPGAKHAAVQAQSLSSERTE
jgi:ketosteroid isomerase-like protein